METNSTQQEILLLTGTKFSSRQWSEKDETGNTNPLSEYEQLQQACWNGLLEEMLPEIYLQHNDKKLYLWSIREGKSFLELELGEFPDSIDKYHSIDPYAFLEIQSYN